MKQMCSYLPPETWFPPQLEEHLCPLLHLCPLYSRSCNDCLLHGAGVVGHAWVLHPWVLVACPLHCLPPTPGAGLLHLLDALCEPPPQVMLHWLQDCHEPQLPWTTGHAWVLHLWVMVSRPLHPEPPPLGAGLLHFLVAFCEPPPQVLLHRLQDCHEPQLPWTTDGPPPGLPASSPWMRNMRIHSPGVIWSWLNTRLWLRSNKLILTPTGK